MRANGLRVESPLGDVHLRSVQVTGEPTEIGPVDLHPPAAAEAG
jgi:2-dehydropantoate 2-reductase